MISRQITTPRQDSWLAGIPLLVLILVLALVLGGGCAPSARPSDPGEGLKALKVALDAWKVGEKPEILARRSPSIRASDGDWESGLSLKSYQADDEGQLVGSDLNYAVDLELKTPRGQVVKKTAVYAVTTHPQLMVLRQNE